jgi:hypothetical protein
MFREGGPGGSESGVLGEGEGVGVGAVLPLPRLPLIAHARVRFGLLQGGIREKWL